MGCASSSDVQGQRGKSWSDISQRRQDSAAPSQRDISSHYKVSEQIGHGATAQVYAAARVWQKEKAWAVKVVQVQSPTSLGVGVSHDHIVTEMELWHRVGRHQHVLHCIQVFEETSRFLFVMERCDGDIFDYIWHANQVNETTMARAFHQMLAGIAHVHSLGVVHRDIKADNFLHQRGTIKLSDFGLARLAAARDVGPPQPQGDSITTAPWQTSREQRCQAGTRSATCSHALQTVAGTAPFMSPEMLMGSGYGTSTDIWSFGATAYVMLLGRFPYQSQTLTAAKMKAVIKQGSPPPSFESDCSGVGELSPLGVAFLRSILQRDPRRRPDARGALREHYLVRSAVCGLETLPCRRHALKMAMKVGAFKSRDLSKQHQRQQDVYSPVSTDAGSSGAGSPGSRSESGGIAGGGS